MDSLKLPSVAEGVLRLSVDEVGHVADHRPQASDLVVGSTESLRECEETERTSLVRHRRTVGQQRIGGPKVKADWNED